MAERMKACTACHGEAGRSAREDYYPSIAGKPAGYLYQQLLNFRDGRRQQAEMQLMLAYLSDGYLKDIADYFAEQKPAVSLRSQRISDKGDASAGEILVQRGDGVRDIPACSSCHGEGLTGMGSHIPGLLGLRAEYIAAQLGAWQVGSRSAREPDCMELIARQLGGQEITDLAQWIAAQPVPPGYTATAESHAPLPMDCGAVLP